MGGGRFHKQIKTGGVVRDAEILCVLNDGVALYLVRNGEQNKIPEIHRKSQIKNKISKLDSLNMPTAGPYTLKLEQSHQSHLGTWSLPGESGRGITESGQGRVKQQYHY